MKHILVIIMTLFVSVSFSQSKEELETLKKANNHIYEANNLANNDDFVSAEMEYRQALSKQPSAVTGAYNLGNSYYKEGNYEEALYRHEQAAKGATSKEERHRAYYNMGNALMKGENYSGAVEAYKNALRNDPTDEETRYNLAIAKKKKKEQDDKNKDNEDENKDDKDKEDKNEDKDKKDENKDNKDEDNKDNKNEENEDDKNKEDNKEDKGDDEKEEDKKDDEGEPKDEKEDKGKNGEDEKKEEKKPQPQPGQLSPQQIKSLLEAMNNQEQKVQEKMNAEKQKGIKVKTEKDW